MDVTHYKLGETTQIKDRNEANHILTVSRCEKNRDQNHAQIEKPLLELPWGNTLLRWTLELRWTLDSGYWKLCQF